MDLNQLRASLGGRAEGRSDQELLSEYARVSGMPAGAVADQFNWKPSTNGQWGNRLGASVDNYQANLYGLGEALGSDWARRGRVDNEYEAAVERDRARNQGAISSYKDVNSVGTGLNYLGGLAVDSLPYLGEAAAGGVLARAASTGLRAGISAASEMGMANAAAQGSRQLATRSNIAGAAASYPSAVGDILSNQREQIEKNGGAGEVDLLSAFAGGVPYAALNAFDPLNRAAATGSLAGRAGYFDRATGFTGGLQRTALNTGRVGLMEGLNETGQEGLNQYFGRMAVDPRAGMLDADALDRYGESFVGGAALGGAFGGAGGGWRRSQGWYEQQDAVRREAFAEAQRQRGLPPTYNLTTDDGGPTAFGQRVADRWNTAPTTPEDQAKREAEYNAWVNAPSGKVIRDPETQQEREATNAEWADVMFQRAAPPVGPPQRDGQWDSWIAANVPSAGGFGPVSSPSYFDLLGLESPTGVDPTRNPYGPTSTLGLQPYTRPIGAGKATAPGAPQSGYADTNTFPYDIISPGSTRGASTLDFPYQYGPPARPGEDTPAVINVNAGGQAGATQSQNQTLLANTSDLGTELARQRIAQGFTGVQATPPGAAPTAAPTKYEIEERRATLPTKLTDGARLVFAQAVDARDAGTISREGFLLIADILRKGSKTVQARTALTRELSAQEGRKEMAAGQAGYTESVTRSLVDANPVVAGTAGVAAGTPVSPGADGVRGDGNLVADGGRAGTGLLPSPRAPLARDAARAAMGDGDGSTPFGALSEAGAKLRQEAEARAAAQAPAKTKAEAEARATTKVDEATGATIKLLPTVESGRTGNTAVEDEASAEFRKSFADRLQRLSGDNRQLLERYLGVRIDESGDLEMTGDEETYEQIGDTTYNTKTRQVGMSKESVRKRIEGALRAAGAPDSISPLQLYRKLGFQVGDLNLETIERMTAVAEKPDAKRAPKSKAPKTDEEAILNEGGFADQEADDLKVNGKVRFATTQDADAIVERTNINDEVIGAEDVAPATDDATASLDEERSTSLDQFLQDDLKAGRVQPSDIAGARVAVEQVFGAGAWAKRAVSARAEAVRYFSRAVAAGDPVALKITRSLNEQQTNAASAGPAGRAPDPGAAEEARGGAGSVPQGDPAADGGYAGASRDGRQVEGAGLAPNVRVKRKLTVDSTPLPTAPRTAGKITLGKKPGTAVALAPAPAPKAQPAPDAIQTPKEQWEALQAKNPGMPAWGDLNGSQKGRWVDLAHRDNGNLAAANRIGSEVVAKQSAKPADAPASKAAPAAVANDNVIENDANGNPLVTELTPAQQTLLLEQSSALSEGDRQTLESQYDADFGTDEFLAKLSEDVIAYVNKGAEAVAKAVRSIVGKVAKAILSVAVVFNVAGLNPQFSSEAYARTMASMPKTVMVSAKETRAMTPAKTNGMTLGANARTVADWVATNAGPAEVSLILDPQDGLLYVMKGGEVKASSPALHGALGVGGLMGGSLEAMYSAPVPEAQKKITPAGKFPLELTTEDPDYGTSITFAQYKTWRIAIHRVYLGDAAERRSQRLQTPGGADNAVSFGCVNVSDEFYDGQLRNLDLTGKAFAYMLPSNPAEFGQFFPEQAAPNEVTVVSTKTQRESQAAGGSNNNDIDYAERRRQAAAPGRQRPKFSKGRKGGSNVARVMTEIARLNLKLDPSKILVVQSVTDLPANLQRSIERDGGGSVQGFVMGDKAYLVADGIQPGEAVSVFLHEVGSHMGLDNLLGAREYKRLISKINEWADRNDGSLESRLAIQALERVATAGTPLSQQNSETIAYFISEAVSAGVDPTALQYKSELGRWMQVLISALKAGLAKLGMRGAPNLTAQDVVDMAYGAANLALNADTKPSTTGAPKFSIAAEDRTAASVLAGMPQPAQDAFTRIRDMFKKVSPWFLTNYQLAKEFGKGTAANIESLTEFMGQSAAAATDRTRMQRQFHDISVEWDKLPSATKASLNRVMQSATLDQVHPDLAFDDEANAHLARTDAAKHAAQAAAYEALPKAAKDVYQSAKKALQDSWDQRAQAYANLVDESYRESLEEAMADGNQERVEKVTRDAAAARREHQKQMGRIKGPYFPLMRFGEYLATGKSAEYQTAEEELRQAKGEARAKAQAKLDTLMADPKHYQSSAHDDVVSMRNAAAVMRTAGLDAKEDMAGLKLDHLRPATQDTVKHVVDAVNRKIGDSELASQVKDVITELYLQGLPEMSALRREAQRKGVTGASLDMLRAFSAAGESNAFYTSRLLHAKDMAETMLKMKAEVRGNIDLMHVNREMQKRMALDMKFTKTPIQDKVSALTWAYQLGVSPAFVLINGLQTLMVTTPTLAGRFGLAKSTSAMGAALRDSLTVLKQARWKDGKWDWWSGIDENSIPGPSRSEDRAAIRQLMQRGILDEGMQHDLNMFANDGSRGIAKASRAMGWATQQVEVVNRMATALAAFRLARQDNKTEAEAIEYAYDMVQGTQFDYSSEGTARIMREGGGVPMAKLVFQFRRYQQGMLYLLGSNIRKSFGTGDEAKHARGAVAYLTVATAAMAGVNGLPLLGVGLFLANLMRDDDDERGDAQTQLRNALFDMTGDKDTATVLAKGLPAMLGMDLSKRVGLADIAAILPMARYEQAKTGRDVVSETLLNAAGPAAGLAAQIVEGSRLIANGDFVKGAEKMVPKAAADAIKAARYSTQGFTDGKGDEVLGADEIGAWNITLRSLGVASTQEANYYEGTKAKKNLETAIKDRKGEIGNAYRAALKSGDMEDVREMIDSFNEDHPAMAIKPKDEVSWRKDAVKRERNREDSGLLMDPKRDQNYEAITRFAR